MHKVEADCASACFYYDIVSQKLWKSIIVVDKNKFILTAAYLETEEHIDEGELGDEDERIECNGCEPNKGMFHRC